MLSGRLVICGAAALAASLFLSSAGGAATAPPEAVVNNFDDALLSVMKNAAKLGYDGRYKQLEPVVRSSFNFPLMTKVVVGSSWAGWTLEQRDAMTDAFRRYTTATYARRFDGYSGETFRFDGTRPLGTGILVLTELVRTSDAPVTLNYLVKNSDGGNFTIVDVYLTGSISQLATQRSEFGAVLQRDGYDGLLAALEKGALPPNKP